MQNTSPASKNPLLRAGRFLWRLRAPQPFLPPRKALILQPCCLSRVMQTTPLLAALDEAFPSARFDWAISERARQAISSNPRVTRTILTGAGEFSGDNREELRAFLELVRAEEYDTCFIPSTAAGPAQVAAAAGIPQRVGLAGGRGLTLAVTPPFVRQRAQNYLALAAAAGVPPDIVNAVETEFVPPDRERTEIARWLVEEFDWLGDTPLVVLHPGGDDEPAATDKRWPAERFARLANHLARRHGARVVLVGGPGERALAGQVAGMVSFRAANKAGEMALGALGALCELADLYVGNDAGSTHVAAATGCPTLAIYGPTDPSVSGPYMLNGRVTALRQPYTGPFSWAEGVAVGEAAAAADALLLAANTVSSS